jgi:hypothetical protein
MMWWARARLRTKIFIAFSSLIIAVLLATLGFTQIVVSREAERSGSGRARPPPPSIVSC